MLLRSTRRSVQIAVLKDRVGLKERLLIRGHPWIFAEEIDNLKDASCEGPGSIVHVQTAGGEVVGKGTLNRAASIAIRLLGKDVDIFSTIRNEIESKSEPFNFGNSDLIPGLFVEYRASEILIKAETAGAFRWVGFVKEMLQKKFQKTKILCAEPPTSKERDLSQIGTPVFSQIAKSFLIDLLKSGKSTILEVGLNPLFSLEIAKMNSSAEVTYVPDKDKSTPEGVLDPPVNFFCMPTSEAQNELKAMGQSGLKFSLVSLIPSQPLESDSIQIRGEWGRGFRPSLKGIGVSVELALNLVDIGGRIALTILLPLDRHHEAVNFLKAAAIKCAKPISIELEAAGLSSAGLNAANSDRWVWVTLIARSI